MKLSVVNQVVKYMEEVNRTMAFLNVIEWVVILLLLYGALTQLIVPAWQGKPLLPYFRKPRRLHDELGKLEEEGEVLETEMEVRRRQRELEKRRRRLGGC